MTTLPVFIPNDPAAELAAMIQEYEALSGHVLAPGQVERLILNAVAYRISLLKAQVQSAAEQNTVAGAFGVGLDNLGELVGVYRLASAPAACTIEFTFVAGHSGVSVPENTRIASGDGKVYFSTAEVVNVAPGVLTAQVEAFATPAGVIGNGYAPGEIKILLDPLPYLLAGENTDVTVGGADQETDEQMKERIRLAPSAFSTAGSRGAYVFHTKSASVLIIDVAVTQPTPGTVQVFPLVEGGVVTPGPLLSLVLAALNDETVRPLTDTVIVTSPTVTTYAVELELVVYNGQDQPTLLQDVTNAVNAYIDAKVRRLGQDVTVDQLIATALLPDRVYSVNVVAPSADVIVGPTAIAANTGVLITITSTTDG